MSPSTQVPVSGALLAVEFHPGAPGQTALPLLMLHAGVADGRMYDAAFTAAAQQRPVLRIDRRGFGRTTVQRAEPHAWVADVVAVLDALNLPRVDVLGCSQGGRIAIDLALAHPHRVGALVLVAPAVTGAPVPALTGSTLARVTAIEAADAAGDLSEVNRLEAWLWLDGPDSAEGRVGGEARALFLAMNGIALRAASPGPVIDAPPAWPRLEAIEAPVCLIWGALDLPHLRARCESMAQRLPQVEACCMPGVAHLPSLEAPEPFNAVLRAVGVLRG